LRPRAPLLGAVAPKYRNPENPAETFAGRGLKPRWLTGGDQVRQESRGVSYCWFGTESERPKKRQRREHESQTRQGRGLLSDHAVARWANSPQPEEEGTVLCRGIEGQGLAKLYSRPLPYLSAAA
jgi:hypothetical protein